MIEGGCRCGAYRYTWASDALPSVHGGRRHLWQSWTGSAFSGQALVGEQREAITSPAISDDLATEDRRSAQRVSDECHSRRCETDTRRPELAVVRPGTFDRAAGRVGREGISTSCKQSWLLLDPASARWSTAAEPATCIATITL